MSAVGDMDELVDLRHLRDENAATIARLEAERAREKTARTVAVKFAEEMREQADAARADAARMRLALEFYADPGLHADEDGMVPDFYGEMDFGEAARDALTPDDGWLARRIEEAITREALEAAGFDNHFNVCAECGRDGGEHSLSDRCPDGVGQFASYNMDEKWERKIARLRALLGGTPTKEGE